MWYLNLSSTRTITADRGFGIQDFIGCSIQTITISVTKVSSRSSCAAIPRPFQSLLAASYSPHIWVLEWRLGSAIPASRVTQPFLTHGSSSHGLSWSLRKGWPPYFTATARYITLQCRATRGNQEIRRNKPNFSPAQGLMAELHISKVQCARR